NSARRDTSSRVPNSSRSTTRKSRDSQSPSQISMLPLTAKARRAYHDIVEPLVDSGLWMQQYAEASGIDMSAIQRAFDLVRRDAIEQGLAPAEAVAESQRAHRAAELFNAGAHWADIAEKLGYGHPSSARTHAL